MKDCSRRSTLAYAFKVEVLKAAFHNEDTIEL